MRVINPTCLGLGLGLALMPSLVSAAEQKWLNLSGFGTIAAVHNDNDQADYRGGINQPNGPGATRSVDFETDSRLGLQALARFSPEWSAVVQVLSEQSDQNNFKPKVEWANIRYQPTENTYIRAGRVLAPVFMTSDYRYVGYSQTTLRPPPEVYFLNPISHVDGVDAAHSFEVGNFTLKPQFTAGKYAITLAGGPGGSLKSKIDYAQLALGVESGDVSFRIAASRFPLTTESQFIDAYLGAIDRLVAAGVPEARTVRQNVKYDKAVGRILTFGVNVDKEKWLLRAEGISRTGETNSILDVRAWYALGGLKCGDFTPYAGYSRVYTREKFNLPTIPGGGLPPPLQGDAMFVNMLNAGQSTILQQSAYTLGVRYEVAKTVAAKLQWDRISKPANANGTLIPASPAFLMTPQKANILSLSVDFVF